MKVRQSIVESALGGRGSEGDPSHLEIGAGGSVALRISLRDLVVNLPGLRGILLDILGVAPDFEQRIVRVGRVWKAGDDSLQRVETLPGAAVREIGPPVLEQAPGLIVGAGLGGGGGCPDHKRRRNGEETREPHRFRPWT